ncbi:Trehalase [Geosporobacter subterraneus DSM 17957]|uniref:Trehalase n=1 Tax=Geosporobacter subterraneus DSM 17957 TaxID=1121919 RepID=A0A1M6MM58_9FIRM|nr:trehalase family glycosidase [Geosporobacter subterraneus]SHJ84568.1 Trehalase [Geosporobacter subterraneus DSM 17957]
MVCWRVIREACTLKKKKYEPSVIKTFEEAERILPNPIISSRRDFIGCYWYAVKLAYKNVHKPKNGSGFVSDFVDAAFNENIFMWDTAFITMFCNLFHTLIPGICSLDNFYCKQLQDGEIPRELVRETGKDFDKWVNAFDKPLYSYFHNHYGHRRLKATGSISYEEMYKPDLGRIVTENPYLTLDNLNHPILAWAEYVSYCQTGDRERLDLVMEPLFYYYKALWYHIRHENHLYVTDWASMDNSPRNRYLGCAVDTSCEMVLFANSLICIMEELYKYGYIDKVLLQDRKEFLNRTSELTKQAINSHMWDEDKGFYFDLKRNGERAPVKTIAGFWAMISGVADEKQAARLVHWLEDERTFKRLHRVPACAADEEEYDKQGGYWKGSVWAPTNTMVIYGLQKYGYNALAREIALNHLDNVVKVFEKTGSIWENYPPDEISSGNADKKDFVGWSGIAPILYLIEFKIGLKADALNQEVIWTLDPKSEYSGCENYWFFGKQASFYAQMEKGSMHIKIFTQDLFQLKINYLNNVYHYTIRGDISFMV